MDRRSEATAVARASTGSAPRTWSAISSRRGSRRSARAPPTSSSSSDGSITDICATPTHSARAPSSPTSSQEKRGHEAGSWAPRGGFAHRGGRLYMTSLAVCTLEVYYRHLPLYRPAALEY